MINKRDWTIVEEVLVRDTILELIFKSNHYLRRFIIVWYYVTGRNFVRKTEEKEIWEMNLFSQYFDDFMSSFYKEQTTSITHRDKQTINVPFNHYHDLRHN